jgi:hypothetical protein
MEIGDTPGTQLLGIHLPIYCFDNSAGSPRTKPSRYNTPTPNSISPVHRTWSSEDLSKVQVAQLNLFLSRCWLSPRPTKQIRSILIDAVPDQQPVVNPAVQQRPNMHNQKKKGSNRARPGAPFRKRPGCVYVIQRPQQYIDVMLLGIQLSFICNDTLLSNQSWPPHPEALVRSHRCIELTLLA